MAEDSPFTIVDELDEMLLGDGGWRDSITLTCRFLRAVEMVGDDRCVIAAWQEWSPGRGYAGARITFKRGRREAAYDIGKQEGDLFIRDAWPARKVWERMR